MNDRGLETDAVVTTADGRWAAIEIKRDAHQIDQGASKLLALQGDMKRDPRATALIVNRWVPL